MSVREIIFDTETTGFDPFAGDRLVEIGALEMIDKIPTGKTYHQYINPEREMSEGAFKVHGLSTEFLSDKPTFPEVAQAFLDFVGDDSFLVAHNAEFDKKFINWHLDDAGLTPYGPKRFIDTLMIAREKFPGAQNSLDALCRRFEIDNSHRILHGALLDSEILAEVYIELCGGRQTGLDFAAQSGSTVISLKPKKNREPRQWTVPQAERDAHQTFVQSLKDPLWLLGDD